MIGLIREILHHYLVLLPGDAVRECRELWHDLTTPSDPSLSEDDHETTEEAPGQGLMVCISESDAESIPMEVHEEAARHGTTICLLPDDGVPTDSEDEALPWLFF